MNDKGAMKLGIDTLEVMEKSLKITITEAIEALEIEPHSSVMLLTCKKRVALNLSIEALKFTKGLRDTGVMSVGIVLIWLKLVFTSVILTKSLAGVHR